MLRALPLIVLLALISALQGQIGGSYTYSYLELSPSARVTALGGYAITTLDDDLTLGYQNPALYNQEMGGRMAFSHAFGPGGIQYGYAAYAGYSEKTDMTFGGGLLYRAYGRFDGRDAAGNWQPGFSASEYALQAGTAYRGDKLSYGANAKLLYSQLESYTSFGMAVDLGATYNDTASLFTASLVMRNIGTQFKAYVQDETEPLPFQVNLGVSKRLRYLPLRLSLTLHDLQKLDTRYDDPNAPQDNGLFFGQDPTPEKNYTADKFFRHVAVGTEFYFGKNFRARFGYDHQTRGELAGEGRAGLTGFSTGFGIRVKQFRLDYGHAITHISGRNNQLTLNVDMKAFGNTP